MNIIEALQALEDGKRIRKINWLYSHSYFYLDKRKGEIKNELNKNVHSIFIDNLFKDDWELHDGTEYFDFFEAMNRIKDGKIVTNKDCPFKQYYLDIDGNFSCKHPISNYLYQVISIELTNSTTWYEVE